MAHELIKSIINRKSAVTFWLLISFVGISQKQASIGLSYQKADVGRGIQLDYEWRSDNRWQFRTGLYFHLNKVFNDDQGHAFHNRGWAQKWYEHFGLGLQVRRDLISHGGNSLYSNYNIHLIRTGYLSLAYFPIGYDPNGKLLYILDNKGTVFQPATNVENSINIGFVSAVSKKINVFIEGGLGINLIYGLNHDLMAPKATNLLWADSWEGMSRFAMGINYNL